MLVRYKCIICQKNKLYFELFASPKVRMIHTANNISYGKKTENKVILTQEFLIWTKI